MAHRANISSGFRWRLLIMAIGGLGFSGFFAFDASIRYPDQQALRMEYEDATAVVGPDEKHSVWAKYAREHGLPLETPKPRSDGDISTQWLLGGISGAVGLLFLFQLVSWQRRFVEGDEEGIASNGTGKIAWDKVTAVSANRWEKKGIAVIEYELASGVRSIVLDDWKLERAPADAIFDLLKANVEADLIEGLTEKVAELDDVTDSDDE